MDATPESPKCKGSPMIVISSEPALVILYELILFALNASFDKFEFENESNIKLLE
jgi:hypothetical protein